ncbi:YhcN/YlaJ family sporulation lipoprotein [Paenibacillus solisilvae]|uniref:YhcN/YlaJ family sporulation lipoprotein n=1 Tax=Paenibacillus solisilvae TaxID=2486751 RepID=A0ABW0W3D9_9BACL
MTPLFPTYENGRPDHPNQENTKRRSNMNKPWKSAAIWIMALAIGSSLTACRLDTAEDKTEMKAKNAANRIETKAAPKGSRLLSDITVRNSHMNRDDMDTSIVRNHLRIAERMESSTERLRGVSKATVIVDKHKAVVGLDVNNNQHGKTVEKRVTRTLKSEFPGYNIYVTSDKAINKKIQAAHADMVSKHPVRQFATEVGVIIEDIGRTITKPFR